MMTTPFRMIFWVQVHFFWILFWPVINMVKTYYAQGQYATAVGEEKTAKHLVLETKETRSVRAHMFEVCIESSFQPLLQIYLVLPCFIQSLFCIDLNAKKFDFTSLQFFSILTSVLSLTFSFTKYFVMKQNGAMDFGFNPLPYALILFATLFQILGRIVCFTLFTYTFGDGTFWPLMLFIFGHVIFVTMVKTAFDKFIGKKLSKASFFDHLINGIANIYFHNQINQYMKEQSGKQIKALDFGQQLFFEFIILLENTIMLISVIVAYQTNTLAIGLMSGSFFLYIFGLALKLVYYKFFYIWKNTLWTDLKDLKSSIMKIRNAKIQARTEPQSALVKETQC